jgi:hypothetical protein
MDGIKISSSIMTILQKASARKPHRELFIDFIYGSVLVARLEISGHYYLNQICDKVKPEFTFSSQLTPYDHDAFRQFVNDVKARRPVSFNLDSCAERVVISYNSNGILSFENSHMNHGLTLHLRYTDQLGKDLEELYNTITRYMELSKEKEIIDFQRRVEMLSGVS